MVRVLMLLEDYGEMIFLQTVLRKIGFDVDAHQNVHALSEILLSFNPEVLVMTAFGRRVAGAELSQTVRKSRELPKIILLHPPAQPPIPAMNVDRWLASPVGATKLVDAIADVSALDALSLREKFSRIKLHEVEAETHQLIEGTDDLPEVVPLKTPVLGLEPSTLATAERRRRFADALAAEPAPGKHGFSLSVVKAQVEALRAAENPASTADLERERRAFVSELFRKK